jgi:hypothetical protein
MTGTVTVRRQWNSPESASVASNSIENLHMSDVSGGVRARAPRAFLHGYVWCDQLIDGELAHSCRHGPGPHRIKVCVVKRDNSKAIYDYLILQMNAQKRTA